MAKNIKLNRKLEDGLKYAKAKGTASSDTTLTIAKIIDEVHILKSIEFGFDKDPTDAVSPRPTLTISLSGTVVKEWPVRMGGVGPVDVYPMTDKMKNQEVVLTLTGGGVGVTGYINVTYY